MKICPTCQRTYTDDFFHCPRDAAPLAVQVTEIEAQLAAGLSRRFRLVRLLGKGGMGAVFLAEQIAVGNRHVALKVLLRTLLENSDFLQRFHSEAASTGRIRHLNVVTIYESGQGDDGTPYIAMEYLEGESLRQALKKRTALPVAGCAEILRQATRGLNAAHKLGIIHRDLKPDNIFLTHGDEGELVVKVVDFGIAKLRESAMHTQTGTVLGTPAYMSFEQASGMKSDDLDARSDIYSLGVVTYEMLTGRLPFQSDTPLGYLRKHLQDAPPLFRAIKLELPALPEVERVVMKALTKDRDRRFDSALEFAREFVRAASAQAPSSGLLTTKAVVLDEQQAEQERQTGENAGQERQDQRAVHGRLAGEQAEARRRAAERAKAAALEHIQKRQRHWADGRAIQYNKVNGRVLNLADNLFSPLNAETAAEFEAADGAELGTGGSPGKMSSLHSSSALVYNMFNYWRRLPLDPLLHACGVRDSLDELRFEQKFPTGLRGNPPNLDLVLSRNGKSPATAIEGKFTEPFHPGDHGGFSASYFRGEGLWAGLEGHKR